MKKEEILNASRKEHQNKDLAEMEVLYLATQKFPETNRFRESSFKRRRPDLNRCIRVLQTHALPLGYCALQMLHLQHLYYSKIYFSSQDFLIL